MDWSTVIPVVAANVVTIIVAVLAWIQSNRSLRESRRQHESSVAQTRAIHDLDAVRTLLDDAALRLHKLSFASIGVSPNAGREAELQAFRELTTGLDELAARLEVRFESEHEIVESYHGAERAAFDLLRCTEEIVRNSSGDSDIAREASQKHFELGNAIDHYRRLFLNDAARWAGAQLIPTSEA